jgi:hypothetical protein
MCPPWTSRANLSDNWTGLAKARSQGAHRAASLWWIVGLFFRQVHKIPQLGILVSISTRR